jgi:FAD synthase
LGRGTNLFEQVEFPTLTVQIEELGKLIPPEGVYAVTLEWNSASYRAMVIVWSDRANSDEFEVSNRNVELHIMDLIRNFIIRMRNCISINELLKRLIYIIYRGEIPIARSGKIGG